MATMDPLHPVQSALIEILAQEFPLSVDELHNKIIGAYGLTLSRQNLYRSIAQLITAQVLVREHGTLALNRIWVSHAVALFEKLKHNYLKGHSQARKFPNASERVREFKAGSLTQLDPLWTDVLVELLGHTRTGKLYAYNSHPWYSIGMRDTERRIISGLTNEGGEVSMLYGNDTYLDRFGQRLLSLNGFHTRCAQQADFPQEGYALWVGGPYLIEVQFPSVITKQFKFFFDSVQSADQFDIELFNSIFAMKARCILSITHNAKRAALLARKLKAYF